MENQPATLSVFASDLANSKTIANFQVNIAGEWIAEAVPVLKAETGKKGCLWTLKFSERGVIHFVQLKSSLINTKRFSSCESSNILKVLTKGSVYFTSHILNMIQPEKNTAVLLNCWDLPSSLFAVSVGHKLRPSDLEDNESCKQSISEVCRKFRMNNRGYSVRKVLLAVNENKQISDRYRSAKLNANTRRPSIKKML